MKKLYIFLTLFIIQFVLVACNNQNTPTEPDITPTPANDQTLVVGVSELNGVFVGDIAHGNMNFNPNEHVKNLLHGYETYTVDKNGRIILNETAIKSVTTEIYEADGNKTYLFEIHTDLYWSNDIKITAKDYVFSLLVQASKEWPVASKVGERIVGYSAYRASNKSESVKFKGIQLIDDFRFSITLESEFSSLFFETIYLTFRPLPFHRLTPLNTHIYSDVNGTWIETNGFSLLADAIKPGGYIYSPDVTCGPYQFVTFINQVVTLKLNPLYKGNFEGNKPVIDYIVVKRVNQTLDVDLVISGDIDLVSGVIEGQKIKNATDSAKTDLNMYTRNGFGMLSLVADFGPTSNYQVRQAIAYLTDRETALDYILDGYGTIINSEYGNHQWMYQDSKSFMDLNMNPYAYSISNANLTLDQTEWIYESDGLTLFDASKATETNEYYRHNAEKEVLELNHFATESGAVNPMELYGFYISMPLAGIKYSISVGTFQVLLDHYYYSYDLEPEDRKYHIFNLATNLPVDNDPYTRWHSDFLGTWQNANQLEDSISNPQAPLIGEEKTLDELTKLMREVNPGDYATYLIHWKAYQLRWNKLLPNIPTYSNQYYSVYDIDLKGLDTSPFWSWSHAICDLYFEG
jgi:peptide/nickel transport system substrate-binding protein